MAKTQMSELQDDTNTVEVLPELKGVKILTETTKSIPDVESDPFLKTFDKNSFSSQDVYKNVSTHMEKSLHNSDGTVKSKQYEENEAVSMYSALDVVEVPYNMQYLAKLYESNSVHAAAVDAKIDNIVGLGYYWDNTRKAEKIRDRAAKKSAEKLEAVENNLRDDRDRLDQVLSEMNAFDEFEEILEKVLKDRFTTGNGYIEVGRRRDGMIGYIGHVSSQYMRVRTHRDGYIQYAGGQPVFFRNFGDKTTPDPFGIDPNPNEIIHLKENSPTNNFYGVPEIVAAIHNIAGIEFANKYNIEYFENKAVPRYIITTSGCTIGKNVHAEILRFFETTTKGKHHRSILIPLPSQNAKIEFTPVETKKQEASFVDYIEQNSKYILARHRVPANRLGITNGAGIGDTRDANKMFKETVCNPEQRLLEKKLGRIFKELTDLFVFKLHEYTLTDENEQSQIQERQLRMGLIVPDEGRAKLGLSARPDGKGRESLDTRALQELALQAQKATIGGPAGKEISQQKATAGKTRTKNANESANKTDGIGATRSRNTKGSGAKER